ncbi:helix-turn-helix transcriptional regulator [Ramlibacter sp.]|uniref:helix-turn-helix transcriptional regulator n=1 Tax=Ramlibacter sp. TaxID=1917967 RepID=UPI0017F9D71D|nr:helix-turn-helix transcriptional regulator [Ramlibacter sp.]MBA2674357.1 helix-turn-helix transcriptional regulator [Ramlibacter sp.]
MDSTESTVFEGAVLPQLQERVGLGLVALLDELAHGMAVVGFDGRMLHANQVALREIGAGRIITLRDRTLQAIEASDGKALHFAMASAKLGKRSLITLGKAAAGGALEMTVLPLKPDAGSALVFARACLCDPLMLSSFSRKHALTGAEEQVLGLLCQGCSAPAIAAQLKVAVSTVRSHVRSVCAKTNSSGVRALVNRVAVLPPLAPAVWGRPLH